MFNANKSQFLETPVIFLPTAGKTVTVKRFLLILLLLIMPILAGCAQSAQPAAVEPAATTLAPAPTAAAAEPAPLPTAVGVSYATDVQPLLDKLCVQCHGPKRAESGLLLDTYAHTMAGSENGSVVQPGNAANSLLVDVVQRGKMPKRGAKLTTEQVDILKAWVEAGAPNN